MNLATQIKNKLRSLKRQLYQLLRLTNDIFSRNYFRLAHKTDVCNENAFKYELSSFEVLVPDDPSEPELLKNRLANFKIVAKCLNGIILNPGEIFSFFYLIGKPSAKKGYKVARCYDGVEVKLAVAGSLCLVTTLLYNVALEANLEIVERHPHIMDIYTDADRYYILGRDATCSYAYKDLRFRNNTTYPIILQMKVVKNRVLSSVSSIGNIGADIEILSEVKEVIKKKIIINSGAKARKGYDGKVVSVVRKDKKIKGEHNINYETLDLYEMVNEIQN